MITLKRDKLLIRDSSGELNEVPAIKGPKGDAGETGPQGPAGSDASVTFENIQTALGYAPADESSIDDLKQELAQKQDTTDDSLSTTSKTVVGAINELNSSINGVDESLTSLEGVI